MPATLVVEHVAPILPSAHAVSVEDLSNGERAVALYASDMPTRYRNRRGDFDLLASWVLQGVMRLGLDELYQSAAYAYGYRLLWVANSATPEQKAAHARRFPSAARLDRAERLAALLTCGSGMTPEAKRRGRQPLVEGACLCAGTGWVAYDMGDGTDALQSCPGHNPGGHLPVRAGVAA
ncbi:hypothetical protein [Streptomyces ossamyceticus]|uniref:hypothetical protein n=1 Tax=Streptomyces ossamyceticus TaxID=249581 RepID=UPI0006E25E62|nr:hypothetical protein [Streptomyces ossamyceticus]